MVAALKRGDEVITSGGIVGTIERIIDAEKAEIAFYSVKLNLEKEEIKVEAKPIDRFDSQFLVSVQHPFIFMAYHNQETITIEHLTDSSVKRQVIKDVGVILQFFEILHDTSDCKVGVLTR